MTDEERRVGAAYSGRRVGLRPLRLCLGFAVVVVSLLHAQSPAAPPAQKETAVTQHARGPFEVKITPQPSDDKSETPLGRMAIDKQYHGDLEGTGKGEMLTGGTTRKDSGVYVAVERVEGTLRGRHGTFLMHHTGVMTRGTPNLAITIVPDSGTGELAGVSGKMNVIIDAGKHSYDLEYTLPDAK